MNHEALVSAMVALARTAGDEAGPERLLELLVDVAAEHLANDGVGLMVHDGGRLRFAHSAGGDVSTAERLQELTQEGPCHDALLFETEIVVDDLRDPVQTAWPEFVRRVLREGFGSVVAVPLVGRGRVWGTLDLYRRSSGTWRPEELQWVRLLAHTAVSYVVMAADRDQARRAQVELAHRSTHDALTGLPNRVLLFDRLEHALHTARRHRRTIAVFFIDLDRFKAVNDTFGHAAGDAVLATVATRLSSILREQDTLARLAGDEFVLVCEDLPGAGAGDLVAHVRALTTRLQRVLTEPIAVGGQDLVVSASVGVAFSGAPGEDGPGADHLSADDLLAEADRAMYRAKQQHHAPGTLELAGPGSPGKAGGAGARPRRSARHLERQLGEAIAEDRLEVHYQPITDPSGGLHAVEALVRWPHPELGLLPAAEFIDLAVASGLVVGMGHRVIALACAQTARWQCELGPAAPRTTYVNLSAPELVDPGLMPVLARALQENGLEPGQLGLELVESSLSDPRVLPSLQEQHLRGHPLSVDHFGTGYSSLSRLVELPVRFAKIDGSFVAGITRDPRRRALVDAVVTVADGLGVRVVAEGVETAAQARAVAEAGCHYLQGHHCGRPRSAQALTARWQG